jgi:hypothetical protein
MAEPVSFASRVKLAFVAFFRVLSRDEFAREVDRLVAGRPDVKPALRLLGLLQEQGRLIDFLQDDVTNHPDDKVGAVARVVHGGCKKALASYLRLEPVRTEPEGSPVTLEAGFDPTRINLTGNVVGAAPFRGTLTHHGWRALELRLPQEVATQDAAILARAEVEI